MKPFEFKSQKDKRAYMEAYIRYMQKILYSKPTVQVFINVDEKCLQHTGAIVVDATSSCPIHQAVRMIAHSKSFRISSTYIHGVKGSLVTESWRIRYSEAFSDEVDSKSISNCLGCKPFTFPLEVDREWLKECSADVY